MESWKYCLLGILLIVIAIGMTEYFGEFLGTAKNVILGLMVAITILSGVAFLVMGIGEENPKLKRTR
ncbi:MAG: hypothetical protein ABII22_02650 [Candidatus Micrarchaeota archaeon]